MNKLITISGGFLLFLLLTGCPREPMPGQSLEGSSWVLLKFSIEDGSIEEPMGDKPITLKFTSGQASGTTGCNSYFATYETRKEQLHFEGIGATERFCEGLMDQEKQYMNLLQQAKTYVIRPGQLEISSQEGKLLFEKEGGEDPEQGP
ncbi:MAG: META domain-containing protein [Lewinellaceae bacterium]|nr:META domain-containing protein [Lewinellaceae bacterium]